MGISPIFGPNYPKIGGRQLNPCIFEHLKEDITLIRKKKTTLTAIHIDFLKTHGNNLKSLASIFQVATRFHPRHLQPKKLPNRFSVLILQLLFTKNRPLFAGFLQHKYLFWLFKAMLKICDRPPLIAYVAGCFKIQV